MEVVASKLGRETGVEPWEVEWSGAQVPRSSACMSVPMHVAHQCQSSKEGLICLAPSLGVKTVNLFLRM